MNDDREMQTCNVTQLEVYSHRRLRHVTTNPKRRANGLAHGTLLRTNLPQAGQLVRAPKHS
jgi:hypothetical protein